METNIGNILATIAYSLQKIHPALHKLTPLRKTSHPKWWGGGGLSDIGISDIATMVCAPLGYFLCGHQAHTTCHTLFSSDFKTSFSDFQSSK